MDDAVDAVDDAFDRRHVEKFGAVDLLAVARRRHLDPIGESQYRVDAAQRLAQRPTDAAPRPGYQHPMHHYDRPFGSPLI